MGLISLFETINFKFNCFCNRKQKKEEEEMDKNIAFINGKYDINILPIKDTFYLSNLYPITDRVERWSVFIVGNDKTYIHVSQGDFNFPRANELPNRKGNALMSDELIEFFTPIWNQTLNGKQLQFYMSVKERLYFVNSYPFINEQKQVIGGILFVRPFSSEKIQAQAPSKHVDEYVRGRNSMDQN